MKRCSKCKLEKSITDFRSDKSKNDGLYSNCKSCESEYDKFRNKRRVENGYLAKSKKLWRENSQKGREEVLRNSAKYRGAKFVGNFTDWEIHIECEGICCHCKLPVDWSTKGDLSNPMSWTKEHLTCHSHGGNYHRENFWPSHLDCNLKRGNKHRLRPNVSKMKRSPYIEQEVLLDL